MNLSHLVLALFITFHKTLFAFVLFSGRHCVVIRSGISRIFPAAMQKAAPGSSGAAYGIIRGQSFFSKRRLPSKPDLGIGFAVCSNLGAL